MPRGFTALDYANGKIERSSVSKKDESWVGYPQICEIQSRLKGAGDLVQNALACTFLTGGRINEVLRLKRENFSFSSSRSGIEHFVVKGMPLEKQYKVLDSFEEIKSENPHDDSFKFRVLDGTPQWYRRFRRTEPVPTARKPFEFRADEPMAHSLKEYILQFSPSEYIFPSPVLQGRHISDTKIWQEFKVANIFPHWLRSQRASCLVVVYSFNEDRLIRWFSWSESRAGWLMAHHYVRLNSAEVAANFDIEVDFGI